MSEEVRSPRPNSDQFDALIELLATDDAGDDSNFHIVPDETVSEGLRDAEGKLDYAKIRSLFLQRRANDGGNHVSTSDQPQSEPDSGTKLPQVSMYLISAEYIVFTWSASDCGGRTDSSGRRQVFYSALTTETGRRAQ